MLFRSFVSPHDASLGPRLLDPSLDPDYSGDIGSVPAPGGVFLHTLTRFHGSDDFRYCPTEKVLVARFVGWENGRARYTKDPVRAVPYEILSSSAIPGPAEAHRQGADTLISLNIDAHLSPPDSLAAVVGVFQNGGFHRWGSFDKEWGFNIQPLLLASEPVTHWSGTIRIPNFPQTGRIQLEFFAAGSQHSPIRLGRSETAVTQ